VDRKLHQSWTTFEHHQPRAKNSQLLSEQVHSVEIGEDINKIRYLHVLSRRAHGGLLDH
jgi:hypothetical protein